MSLVSCMAFGLTASSDREPCGGDTQVSSAMVLTPQCHGADTTVPCFDDSAVCVMTIVLAVSLNDNRAVTTALCDAFPNNVSLSLSLSLSLCCHGGDSTL
eukprot:Tamp_17416.p3 GENE.Tamp_17416~~Tamp_17416.p3  ORF type:complete len:100 (+),score=7.72 Tamp_17416:222-521(+)